MKSSETFLWLCILATFLAACDGAGHLTSYEPPSPNVVPQHTGDLETLTYETTGSGEVWAKVIPNIYSKEDLLAYRDMKIAEAAEILELTKDETEEKPYYQAVITMRRPLPLPQFMELIQGYNSSTAKSGGLTDLVPGEDKLIVNVVRFVSTSGGGQLSAESLSNAEELAELESKVSNYERQFNGVNDYQLIKGVTSILGGIHRDRVMRIQDEPDVFLADIGPAGLYQGTADRASWDNLYPQVEEYLDQ
jgi:hypothetical protein